MLSHKQVAVAMSVYKSDKFDQVQCAALSILEQTYKAIDLFIAVDGPVAEDVRLLLSSLEENENVYILWFGCNLGLAARLNDIIDTCVSKGGYGYLARMDADDISEHHRIEEQVKFMESNPETDISGTDIVEFYDNSPDTFYKKMGVSHDYLVANIIKRCPFNHPTVIFKMDIFSNLDMRYKSYLKNTQDYYFWVDLICDGYKFGNLNQPLLKFRINEDFHRRRGLDKAMNDLNGRIYAFKRLNNLSLTNVTHTLLLFVLRVLPASFKKIIYSKFR